MLSLHKTIKDARFEMRSVLTTDPFDYVDLWLRRNGMNEALFYWRQSHAFHKASRTLPIESAPLVLYYCFINAAKALLSSKEVIFKPYHGVSAHPMRGADGKVVLSNEGIKIKADGIVPALAAYFGEAEPSDIHSLEGIFYNLAFIHRTYCLSYATRKDQFLPLKSVVFVRDDRSGEAFLRAQPVDDADWGSFKRALPPEVIASPDGSRLLYSATRIAWATKNAPTVAELGDLRHLNQALRRVIHYINGAQTLWYLKSAPVVTDRRRYRVSDGIGRSSHTKGGGVFRFGRWHARRNRCRAALRLNTRPFAVTFSAIETLNRQTKLH